MLDSLFLNAINARSQADGIQQDHIYLKQYEIPQIILFDILINKLPFVKYAHAITNKAIARSLEGSKRAVLLDVGIGRGLQTIGLLNLLKTNSTLKELTIVGIELAEDAMQSAKDSISKAVADVPFKVDFVPIVALMEKLDPTILKNAIPAEHDELIVNSSLTLHHIYSKQDRKMFFQQMKEIKADSIFLTEPDSDHFTDNWEARLQNAYTHYQAVFEVIDQLDITAQEKNGLKLFFGREIDDVVGNSEDQRFEKHELGETWVGYLKAAGFDSEPFKDVPDDLIYPAVQFKPNEGYLSIQHNGVGVLALIQASKLPV